MSSLLVDPSIPHGTFVLPETQSQASSRRSPDPCNSKTCGHGPDDGAGGNAARPAALFAVCRRHHVQRPLGERPFRAPRRPLALHDPRRFQRHGRLRQQHPGPPQRLPHGRRPRRRHACRCCPRPGAAQRPAHARHARRGRRHGCRDGQGPTTPTRRRRLITLLLRGPPAPPRRRRVARRPTSGRAGPGPGRRRRGAGTG